MQSACHDSNIIEASALAYLNALNKVLSGANAKAIHPQRDGV